MQVNIYYVDTNVQTIVCAITHSDFNGVKITFFKI